MQINNNHYVSYDTLKQYGININTIKSWQQRKRVIINKIDGYSCILYDSIPLESRSKLPSLDCLISISKNEDEERYVLEYYSKLINAKEFNFMDYKNIYSGKVKDSELIMYAKKHAVFEEILTLRDECKNANLRFVIKYVWKAFDKIYPKSYVFDSFRNALRICINNGIDDLLIKKYHPIIKFDSRYNKMVMDCLSSGKNYTQKQIHEKICTACEKSNIPQPGLTWVKEKCILYRNTIIKGESHFYNEKPYMGLIQAQNANTQWQIDGWRLPFYMKDFRTLTIFAVIDTHTRKIIGSCVSESENTETILKALEYAVSNTGVLPFEIVSDNHSFNQTKEAEFLKESLSVIGTTWNVSMNPRRKSTVERSFRDFGDNYCKNEYGYTGQGIKTRIKSGRPTQELIDKAVKNPLLKEQILLIAGRLIEQYNDTRIKSKKISPNQLYDQCINDSTKRKKSFALSSIEQLKLFVRRSETTVRRGQITIQRGGVKHEFEVSAKQFIALNNNTFGIRYRNFDEVMLFDLKTDQYIDTVYQKKYAHAALGDQTEEDKELFFKHKGRLNGINNAIKKEQERVFNEASNIDPDAPYMMNPLLTPKSTFEEYKQSRELSLYAERHNVIPENVPDIKVECEKDVYEPDKKRKDTPFQKDKKYDLSKFNLTDY